MTVYDAFLQRVEDYKVCKLTINAARRNAKDIAAAVAARLEAERVQTAARIKELEKQQNDPERSSTVLAVGAIELEQLRNREFRVLPEERAAFEEEISRADTAYTDLYTLIPQIREAISNLNAEITEQRKKTLGEFDGQQLKTGSNQKRPPLTVSTRRGPDLCERLEN